MSLKTTYSYTPSPIWQAFLKLNGGSEPSCPFDQLDCECVLQPSTFTKRLHFIQIQLQVKNEMAALRQRIGDLEYERDKLDFYVDSLWGMLKPVHEAGEESFKARRDRAVRHYRSAIVAKPGDQEARKTEMAIDNLMYSVHYSLSRPCQVMELVSSLLRKMWRQAGPLLQEIKTRIIEARASIAATEGCGGLVMMELELKRVVLVQLCQAQEKVHTQVASMNRRRNYLCGQAGRDLQKFNLFLTDVRKAQKESQSRETSRRKLQVQEWENEQELREWMVVVRE
ncbi:hypothetical protein DRE_00197 [Drechslerella stenobrocha 248]|uniref:Uncharacterized protein n=1 Tax=Drechslerella stenobrocha 248 TaxID=1043628 RepID=W7I9W4_9PEZI|nr:hypothetical protein DRE_00197 [Drechslerella stenobrocha 248]